MLSRARIPSLLNAVCCLLLAVLLAAQVAAAFLPIASGGGRSDAALTGVICTAEGMRTITLPEGANPDATSEGSTLQGHCPLCILAADLPNCADRGGTFRQAETRLRAQFAAMSQTSVRFGGRPDAIRAPPRDPLI